VKLAIDSLKDNVGIKRIEVVIVLCVYWIVRDWSKMSGPIVNVVMLIFSTWFLGAHVAEPLAGERPPKR
jgi:hypothetical protein